MYARRQQASLWEEVPEATGSGCELSVRVSEWDVFFVCTERNTGAGGAAAVVAVVVVVTMVTMVATVVVMLADCGRAPYIYL